MKSTPPPNGWEKLKYGLYVAVFLLGCVWAVAIFTGCASGDANALKILFNGVPDELPATQPAVPSRTHFENTQSLARKSAKDSEAALTKLEKFERWADLAAEWGIILTPILGGGYASLKLYNKRQQSKRRDRRATDAKGAA